MSNFAIIGKPLGHSVSPVLHQCLFEHFSLDAHYDSRETESSGLTEIIRDLREGALDGINVTLPHKVAILPHLDRLSGLAADAGAVNCVYKDEQGRLVGDNTDVEGIRWALGAASGAMTATSVLIVGTGGAARAGVVAMLRSGVVDITVTGRREMALTGIADHFLSHGDAAIQTEILSPVLEIAGYDLIIHATPVGMWPEIDGLIPALSKFREGQIVLDMVYRPIETALLRRAKADAARAVYGLDMLLGQGIASFNRWFPDHAINLTGDSHSGLITKLRNRLKEAIAGQP